MRSIGALYSAASASAYFDQTLLPPDYDALIWFATRTTSILLPFRQRAFLTRAIENRDS